MARAWVPEAERVRRPEKLGVVVTFKVMFPVKAPPPVRLVPAVTVVELGTAEFMV